MMCQSVAVGSFRMLHAQIAVMAKNTQFQMQLAKTLLFILLGTDEAMVMDAFMISSLDYYNSLSLGMKPHILKKLQMVQTAACMFSNTGCGEHITSVFCPLN